ncbi:hypothetical protein SAMN05216404_11032 [Nitrosospira multiformis]|uniref:Uncharacterized protein n=1 Tax=Nitrosospira multiformis TaxID=1231 RepID=A0A1H8L9M5_9PROT|nr:hypothetical protein [Nitrosospira multiformis]SEO01852.1 hypothetical protein SAMN05216404_11032 [Nitrosospira multiformis]
MKEVKKKIDKSDETKLNNRELRTLAYGRQARCQIKLPGFFVCGASHSASARKVKKYGRPQFKTIIKLQNLILEEVVK